MSGYDCRNKCVFSFRRKTVNDEAYVMSSRRLFHGFGRSEANDRSPTVTRRDWRAVSWLEVDDRRRLRETACQQRSSTDQTVTEAQSREELGRRWRQFERDSLGWTRTAGD